MSHDSLSAHTPAPRKPWLVTLASPKFAIPLLLLLALLAAPLVYRGTQLHDVPDIGHPFDFEALVNTTVPPEGNANNCYVRAVSTLKKLGVTGEENMSKSLEGPWSQVHPDIQRWVLDNPISTAEFLRGADRPDTLGHPLAKLIFTTTPFVSNELRALGRLARLEGLRREAAGDFAGAWTWYQPLFNVSRHCAQYGYLLERLFSHAFHADACDATLRWATQPKVDAALLRQALYDVEQFDLSYPPISVAFQVEYIALMNTLTHPEFATNVESFTGSGTNHRMGKVVYFCLAEPDLLIRILQLQLANVLTCCDLPPYARPKEVPGMMLLFDHSPGATPATVAPADIQRWFSRSPLAKLLSFYDKNMLESADRHRMRQTLTRTALALQIYHREHARFPESLAELRGSILAELPPDPFGHLKSRQPDTLQYRREPAPSENATLWSIGFDRTDDGGTGQSRQRGERGDYVLPLYKPGTAPVEPSPDN